MLNLWPCGVYYVQAGGNLTGAGGGSNLVAVDNGGVVSGTGGGGSWIVYVKAGGSVDLSNGGGSHTVYYEDGATVIMGSSGSPTKIPCETITVSGAE